MTVFDIILLIVGLALLALGGISGGALFARAVKISDRFGDETNVGTVLPNVRDDIYLTAAAQALYGTSYKGGERSFAPRQMNRRWANSIK